MKKVYLAIPYTGMEESSYEQATLMTGILMSKFGHNIFSPITHCHPLHKLEGLDIPGTWEYWQKVDYQFIDWADEVWIVVPNEGQDRIHNSVGVQAEMNYARLHGKTIRIIDFNPENPQDIIFYDELKN